jgi:hypothetical protein
MHCLEYVDGRLHSLALVRTVIADEYVGDDFLVRLADDGLSSDAGAQLDALGLRRGGMLL